MTKLKKILLINAVVLTVLLLMVATILGWELYTQPGEAAAQGGDTVTYSENWQIEEAGYSSSTRDTSTPMVDLRLEQWTYGPLPEDGTAIFKEMVRIDNPAHYFFPTKWGVEGYIGDAATPTYTETWQATDVIRGQRGASYWGGFLGGNSSYLYTPYYWLRGFPTEGEDVLRSYDTGSATGFNITSWTVTGTINR